MAKYSVRLKASAVREIESIPQRRQRQRMMARIESLATDPRPSGCEKLTGGDRYKVRQGDYRIVYSVDDAEITVYVVKVGHRSSVYRAK